MNGTAEVQRRGRVAKLVGEIVDDENLNRSARDAVNEWMRDHPPLEGF